MAEKEMVMRDKPFPLKRYYLLYAGIGGIVFYALLFSFFVHAERQTLHNQYIENLVEKANAFYRDVNQDVLIENNASFDSISFENQEIKKHFREKVEKLVKTDFTFAKVKVFNKSGTVLYDHKEQANEGGLYDAVQGEGFQAALADKTFSKLEEEPDGRRFMEVYLPTHSADSKNVTGVLEIYEDVTRFEEMVFVALKQALIIPTFIFIAFNLLLLMIVLKADGIITVNTMLLINVKKQMEKYISRSATEAIYSAVTEEKELFKGELQNVVTFFSDIRGFTSYSENEAPETVVKNLNMLFEVQAGIIHEYHGVIDKFVGDEIMALFPDDKVSAAVEASLKIIAELEARKDIDFEVGIGVHMGHALVGSIGTQERRDYTAIGNTINTGARFCGAAKAGQLIISDAVYQHLSPELQARFALSEPLQLKGKRESIVTYAA